VHARLQVGVICATLINMETEHIHKHIAFWLAYMISSASWTKNNRHKPCTWPNQTEWYC